MKFFSKNMIVVGEILHRIVLQVKKGHGPKDLKSHSPFPKDALCLYAFGGSPSTTLVLGQHKSLQAHLCL